eukprot:2056341-Pyramimonas_sp.AAC.1
MPPRTRLKQVATDSRIRTVDVPGTVSWHDGALPGRDSHVDPRCWQRGRGAVARPRIAGAQQPR